MQQITRLMLLLLMLPVAEQALARQNVPLDTWVERELVPVVVDQLSNHVRFRSDVVRFVVLDDDRPSANSNELTIAVRDKLQDAVIEKSSIRVAWQVNREKFDRFADQTRVDCTTSEVYLYVGIEIRELGNQQFEASVRALDVEEQNWIPGFGARWTGKLTASEARAFRQPESDSGWLGQRTVPFEETQSDLLAAQIARDLGCALLREMSGEYVAALAEADDTGIEKVLGLVSHNLAPYHAIRITNTTSGSNSIIAASAHTVGDDLYQYWVTVTPTDGEMPSVSASAYIYLPEQFLEPSLASAAVPLHLRNDASLISSLEVVKLQGSASCAQYGRSDSRGNGLRVYDRTIQSQDTCLALQATPRQDMFLFFLYHQLNNGLVRMANESCSDRVNVRVARDKERVLMPLGIDPAGRSSWLPNDNWMLEPDEDTFYAIAVSNTRAARALAAHIERLPKKCNSSLRPGLDGSELRRWFRELNEITSHWPADVDWRSVRIKSVY